MVNWEETEEYKKWRKDFPHAAEEYDREKQKESENQQKQIVKIREYKKKQYSEMSQAERRKHLSEMKKYHKKRKKK